MHHWHRDWFQRLWGAIKKSTFHRARHKNRLVYKRGVDWEVAHALPHSHQKLVETQSEEQGAEHIALLDSYR
jgi:hypothetical protein